jgi:hypothetical protein
MEQTAVEWLVNKLPQRMLNYLKEEIEQAKEMEKQQIINAYNKAVPFKFGKEYYNKTFKNK